MSDKSQENPNVENLSLEKAIEALNKSLAKSEALNKRILDRDPSLNQDSENEDLETLENILPRIIDKYSKISSENTSRREIKQFSDGIVNSAMLILRNTKVLKSVLK